MSPIVSEMIDKVSSETQLLLTISVCAVVNAVLSVYVCDLRLVEFNSCLVCGLGVGEFNDLVTSLTSHDDECRILVLRSAVECGDEVNSLSHDISQW